MISLADVNNFLSENYGIMIVAAPPPGASDYLVPYDKPLSEAQRLMIQLAHCRNITIKIEKYKDGGHVRVTGTRGDTCCSSSTSAMALQNALGDPIASLINEVIFKGFGV